LPEARPVSPEKGFYHRSVGQGGWEVTKDGWPLAKGGEVLEAAMQVVVLTCRMHWIAALL